MKKNKSHEKEKVQPEEEVCECCINIRALISLGILLIVGYILIWSIMPVDEGEIPKQLHTPVETLKSIFRWPLLISMALGAFIGIGQSIKCVAPLIEEMIKKIFGTEEERHPAEVKKLNQISDLIKSNTFTTVGATGVVLGLVLTPGLHAPKKLETTLPLTIDLKPTVNEGPAPTVSLSPQILVAEAQKSEIPVTLNIKTKFEGTGENTQTVPSTIKISVDDDAKKWLSELKIAIATPKPDDRLDQLSAVTTDLYLWSSLKEQSMTKYQAQIQQMSAELIRLAVETNFAQRTAFSAVQTSQSSTEICQTAAWRPPEEIDACSKALESYKKFKAQTSNTKTN